MKKISLLTFAFFFMSCLLVAQTAASITQYGITWTFDKPYQTGQFASGDYWVVGPVKIIGITPGSTVLPSGRVVSGSMLNPAPSWEQGYDSLIYGTKQDPVFKPNLNAGRPNNKDLTALNPLVIPKPASLVTGVSYTDHPASETNQVHLMAVLTVLDSVPPAGAFRPPFTGNDKSIRHTIKDMNYGLLPKVAVPAAVTKILDIKTISPYFQKLWPDHMMNWYKERFLPMDNMPNYGRDLAALVSVGALLLVLDKNQTEKELLAQRMVQIGLDIYGLIQQPDGNILYMSNGGHCCGRAFPMVLAGYLLKDQAILAVMKKAGQYAYQNGHYEGNLPTDMVQFQELDQTFYVTQRAVDMTHSPEWKPDDRTPVAPYTTSDIGIADWGIGHATTPKWDNASWQSNYRHLNSYAWGGFVLAARIMGIQDLFNQPALFDYLDRWMTIGFPKSGGSARSYTEFQDQMWTSLRPSY
jgi:hypothetical protein